MSEAYWRWSATEIAAGVRSREVSAEAVAHDAVRRMREANGPLNAVTRDCGASALEAARALDVALGQGIDPGPLAGVPVTIKDNVDVRGQSSPNGIAALDAIIAPDDAPVVRNLRRAGAIVIGRTNAPEFSLRAFTDNKLFGLTRNPWDDSLNCGGSSGGAGAAVAAGIGAIAHGNDIGGSLRIPAFCCGVATIRPTLGRIPAFNPSAQGERGLLAQLMSVQGPIAREVRDVRLGLHAMAEGDPRDPWWVPAPLVGPPVQRPIRVAVVTDAVNARPIHSAVLAAIDEAAGILSDAGYAVEHRQVPKVARIAELWSDLMLTEIEVLQRAMIEQAGSDDFKFFLGALYKSGRVLSRDEYIRGQMERTSLLREWLLFLDSCPLVLCPMMGDPPFPVGFDVRDEVSAQAVIDSMSYSAMVNMLGLPSAAVPVRREGRAPVGVQIIGPRYREDICLDAAEAIEARVGVMAKALWG